MFALWCLPFSFHLGRPRLADGMAAGISIDGAEGFSGKSTIARGVIAKVSTEASSVAVWVIATNEELQIARHSHLLVGGGR